MRQHDATPRDLLVAGLQNRSEVGSRTQSELDQVPPLHDALGSRRFDIERPRPLQKPIPCLESLELERRAPGHVRSRHTDPAVDSPHPPRQPAHGGVARAGLEELERCEMRTDQGDHRVDQGALVRHPAEEASRRCLARGLVTPRRDPAALHLRGRSGLPQVVTEDRQSHDEILPLFTAAFGGKGVHAVKRVNPHVTLRVPFGILLAADQGLQLREVSDPSAGAK